MSKENPTMGNRAVEAGASAFVVIAGLIIVFGLLSPLFLPYIYQHINEDSDKPQPPKDYDDLLKQWNEHGRLLMGPSWDDPKEIEWRSNLVCHPKPSPPEKKVYQYQYAKYMEDLAIWEIGTKEKRKTVTIAVLVWWVISIGIFAVAHKVQYL